jgi:hypothetical protein
MPKESLCLCLSRGHATAPPVCCAVMENKCYLALEECIDIWVSMNT